MNARAKWVLRIALLSIFYVLLGNARSVQENPFIPGAVIAVAMIVPVVAGILFGPSTGFLTGIIGTGLNALTPAGSAFEIAAIIPHGIMGFYAGILRKSLPSPICSLTVIIGHSLNLIVFILFGLMQVTAVLQPSFWYGLSYEIFINIVAIIILIGLYRIAFAKNGTKH